MSEATSEDFLGASNGNGPFFNAGERPHAVQGGDFVATVSHETSAAFGELHDPDAKKCEIVVLGGEGLVNDMRQFAGGAGAEAGARGESGPSYLPFAHEVVRGLHQQRGVTLTSCQTGLLAGDNGLQSFLVAIRKGYLACLRARSKDGRLCIFGRQMCNRRIWQAYLSQLKTIGAFPLIDCTPCALWAEYFKSGSTHVPSRLTLPS